MQNKANFLKDKINATFFATKDYENEPRLTAPGKQTQSNPISKEAPMLLSWRQHLPFAQQDLSVPLPSLRSYADMSHNRYTSIDNCINYVEVRSGCFDFDHLRPGFGDESTCVFHRLGFTNLIV